MIYLDNAATTIHKPEGVAQAMVQALSSLGNSGRGAHEATLDASRIIYGTREKLARLFGIKDPMRIAFTCNATESLNIAINGLFEKGDHVITTMCEHNSVLRPLYCLEENGGELSILPADSKGVPMYGELEQLIQKNTRAIVITHASNLSGNVTDLGRVSAIAQKYKLLLVVDASQSAGCIPIDVEKMGIDVLCFTGHKGLMGPQGTGGIYVREGLKIRPLKVGGSGVPARNMKGLVTFDRKLKKDIFYWYKANWSQEPVLYLTQRRLVERERGITSVTVYCNTGEPAVRLNGKRLALRPGTTAVHFVADSVRLRRGKNVVTATAKDGAGNVLTDRIEWHYAGDRRESAGV